ncbi:MAG: heavy metal translocating P-type ATPase, partial [Clostridia bacterium]|nr:heavy metal translocating P-type ATPase [Clostridia bacterium]
MGKYNVTGMSCAACSSRVEKAVSSLDGVTSCSVSLLTNSMLVEGDIDSHAVIKAVEAAGYGASLQGESDDISTSLFKDTETPKLRKRLIISVCFLIPLMIFSMGAHFNILPAFISDKYILLATLQLVFSSVLLVVNSKFFKNGVKGVIKRSPNMDTLVALGSGISYIYSVVLFILMCVNFENKDYLHAVFHEKGLYFESAGMILVLITIGKTLEAFSKRKTTNALKNLIKLQPSQAILLTNGEERVVPYQEIKVGDIFVVKAGAAVPVDGEIIEGEGAFDESSLTGESIPADKSIGEKIYASTVNTSGYVVAKATTVGEGTALGKIIKTVSDAVATKAPIAKIADTVSGFFVPVVILIAVIATVIWLLCGAELGYALERGISVLVISCPCALGLATPVAIMVGSGIGAKKGILFKDAAKLELLGKCDIILLDKTGTITEGKPEVTDVIP